jgi:tRNA threonylcarbamoyladenosine biosynthesis protein TsaE
VTAVARHGSADAEATEELGQGIAGDLAAGDVLFLEGELGAGKTTLVRGLVTGLGGDPEDVSSPSFVLLQSYRCRLRKIAVVHHVDLYRVADDLSDLREIGLEEVLSDGVAVVAIEWPRSSLEGWLPPGSRLWHIDLRHGPDGSRQITVRYPE